MQEKTLKKAIARNIWFYVYIQSTTENNLNKNQIPSPNKT